MTKPPSTDLLGRRQAELDAVHDGGGVRVVPAGGLRHLLPDLPMYTTNRAKKTPHGEGGGGVR